MKLEPNLNLDRCPHCDVKIPNLTTRWSMVTNNHAGKNRRLWHTYLCGWCGGIVTAVGNPDTAIVSDIYPEKASETFEFEFLKGDLAEDFKEALKCYSIDCYNAFAAMCRRTVQSMSTELGADGKDRVTKQLKELKEIVDVDEETFKILDQIIIAGHDGAHPHLPKLSPERASILLELMKDVIYQLFIRKQKIEIAAKLRQQAIEGTKGE